MPVIEVQPLPEVKRKNIGSQMAIDRGGRTIDVIRGIRRGQRDRVNAPYERGYFQGSPGDDLTETGTITRAADSTLISTGSTIDTPAGIHSLDPNTFKFTKEAELFCELKFNENTLQRCFIGVGKGFFPTSVSNAGVLTLRHFGFIVDDATLYASNADGATQNRTQITGITLTGFHRYKVIYSSSVAFGGINKIKFYIDDVLVTTHTLNIPVNSSAAPIQFAIYNDEAVAKTIDIFNNYIFVFDKP